MEKYNVIDTLILLIFIIRTKIFNRKARLIRFPFKVRGKKYIKISKGFTTGYGCRIDAFPTENEVCVEIGKNFQMNDYVHIGAVNSIKIGDNVLIASRVFITDHDHGKYKGDGSCDSPLTPPKDRKLISEKVEISDNVWIGENVSILSGVTIGKGSIIAANALVNKNVPEGVIVGGNPAKILKKYNYVSKKWEKSHEY